MVTIRIATAAELDLQDVLDLYNSVGWSAYTDKPEALGAALAGSSLIVEARLGTELAGLARVISDNATICYLQDILVRPSHQREGIGRMLVTEALARFAHVRQKVLLTDDEPGQKAFYDSLGYRSTTEFGDGTLRAFVRFD
ncbi:GNAT family N-acetyltransferase [Microbacterium sp. STN6]|uniref:GNAT family N-acetyltransferase n=1 Tax=Microbacterium sp. STN6 TaxID=2995588 RepID=UPI002261008F|nr:GNAT family N-acetyltransferase [Microbacterium sp. STN6]MCX7521364.1 GNAT family N-acetyltransferase [Microbacterium sp. STN6]